MRKLSFHLFTVVLLLTAGSSSAQFSMFVKAVDNTGTTIIGNSKNAAHPKEIEILSESFGASNPCGNCPSLSAYNVMLQMSGAVAKMMQMCYQGTHLQSVDVSYRRSADSFDFYKIRMENVLIESVQESGSVGGDVTPTVSMSFKMAKIAWQFTELSTTGGPGVKTKGGWDDALKVPWSYF